MKTKGILVMLLLVAILPMLSLGNVCQTEQLESDFETILLDDNPINQLVIVQQQKSGNNTVFKENDTVVVRPKSKVIAVSLAITLGVFGVHRLYLGTSTKVPIIYTLTLGGGFGVLVLSDIIAIIAAKDLEEYASEPKAFMWAK